MSLKDLAINNNAADEKADTSHLIRLSEIPLFSTTIRMAQAQDEGRPQDEGSRPKYTIGGACATRTPVTPSTDWITVEDLVLSNLQWSEETKEVGNTDAALTGKTETGKTAKLTKDLSEFRQSTWGKKEFDDNPIPESCTCKKLYNWYEPLPCSCTESMKERNKVCSSCHVTQTRSCHRNCGMNPMPLYTIHKCIDNIPALQI